MRGTTQTEWARLLKNVHKNTTNNKADEVKYKITHFAVPIKLGKRILNELIYAIHSNRMRSFHDRSTFTRLKFLIEFQCRLKNIIYEERKFAKQNYKLDDILLESQSIWDTDVKLKLDTNLNIYLS